MYMRIYALHKRRLSTPSHAKHYNSHGRRSRGFPRWICRTSNVASRRSFLTTTRGSQRRHVLARRRVESSKRASGDIQDMRAKISLRVREGLHPKSLVLRVWARWNWAVRSNVVPFDSTRNIPMRRDEKSNIDPIRPRHRDRIALAWW